MFLAEWRKTRSKGWNFQGRVRMCASVCVYLWQNERERALNCRCLTFTATFASTENRHIQYVCEQPGYCHHGAKRTNNFHLLIRKTLSVMQNSANSKIWNIILFSNTLTWQATYFPLINNLTMKFAAVVTLLSVVHFWHRHPTIKLAPAHHNPKWYDNWAPI